MISFLFRWVTNAISRPKCHHIFRHLNVGPSQPAAAVPSADVVESMQMRDADSSPPRASTPTWTAVLKAAADQSFTPPSPVRLPASVVSSQCTGRIPGFAFISLPHPLKAGAGLDSTHSNEKSIEEIEGIFHKKEQDRHTSGQLSNVPPVLVFVDDHHVPLTLHLPNLRAEEKKDEKEEKACQKERQIAEQKDIDLTKDIDLPLASPFSGIGAVTDEELRWMEGLELLNEASNDDSHVIR